MNALILLSVSGLFSMIAGLFNLSRQVIVSLLVCSLAGSAVLAAIAWGTDLQFYGMAYFDNYALAFTILLCSLTLTILLLSGYYFEQVKQYASEHLALIVFALAGMVCMVSFDNLTMLFIGIEIMSVSLYILAGTNKGDTASNEASLKYFLMGAFATGLLLMGITLIYGEAGTFDLDGLSEYYSSHEGAVGSPLTICGVLLILAGLGFKVSAAPFHFWAPDVYQGSPTLITSFMSTAVKVAGFAAFYRLFSFCFLTVSDVWVHIVSVMSIATISIGSISALMQADVKRMLAYSSISHAGYMLIALVVAGGDYANLLFFYGLAYSVSSIAAFGVLMYVQKMAHSTGYESFNGLSKKSPLLALVMTVSMLSMAGIPLTGGFFAKFYMLSVAIESGYIALSVIAIINAIAGIYYYLQVVIAMYIRPGSDAEYVEIGTLYKIILILLTVFTIVLGIFPDIFSQLIV